MSAIGASGNKRSNGGPRIYVHNIHFTLLWRTPSTAECSPPSMPNTVVCVHDIEIIIK